MLVLLELDNEHFDYFDYFVYSNCLEYSICVARRVDIPLPYHFRGKFVGSDSDYCNIKYEAMMP